MREEVNQTNSKMLFVSPLYLLLIFCKPVFLTLRVLTVSGKHINQLMTADGTTFVFLGEAFMAHGSSTKMELCICTPEDIG